MLFRLALETPMNTIDNRPPASVSGFLLLAALVAGSILLAYGIVWLVQ